MFSSHITKGQGQILSDPVMPQIILLYPSFHYFFTLSQFIRIYLMVILPVLMHNSVEQQMIYGLLDIFQTMSYRFFLYCES